MTNRQSLGRILNTWMQVIGIFAAATWGVYTFVHKEILLPRSAPVNITMDLELSKVGTNGHVSTSKADNLVAVEMVISAENPSSREVYLLPSAWVAYGYRVTTADGHSMPENGTTIASDASRNYYLERHSALADRAMVATGGLFSDEFLKPKERIERTIMFHVPSGAYDLLEVYTVMPTAARAGGIELEWKLDSNQNLEPFMYRVEADGERKPMKKDEDGGYHDPNLELQQAHSQSQLSLWH
jgi:hypothetical protein